MWIECSSEMPQKDEQVLIRLRGTKRYETGRWVPCDGWWNCYTHFRYDHEVSHWMPILDIDDKQITTTLRWTKTAVAKPPPERDYLCLYPGYVKPMFFAENGHWDDHHERKPPPFAWAHMPDLGPILPDSAAGEVWMYEWLCQLPHTPEGSVFQAWIDDGWNAFWRTREVADAFYQISNYFSGHDMWRDETLPLSTYMASSQKCLDIAVEYLGKSNKYGERKLAEMICRAQQSIEKGKQNEQA